MINGECLCGAVRFQIDGPPTSLSYCHCSRCRKSAGVYSAVLVGKAQHFTLLQGEESIARYKPDGDWKFERCFCKHCGSSLGDMVTGSIYVVAASLLDNDPGILPTVHIHTDSRPPWYDIDDNLKKFPGDYHVAE